MVVIMGNKQTRILLIEPDASRREFIESALTDISPEIEFRVLSDIQHCRHELEASTSTMAFSPVQMGKPSAEVAELKQFVAKLSHDLRNPLGVILNSVYVLKKMGFDDPGFLQKYLEIIEQEAISMNQILSDRASGVLK
jgi:signal transduction histidine kinase